MKLPGARNGRERSWRDDLSGIRPSGISLETLAWRSGATSGIWPVGFTGGEVWELLRKGTLGAFL